MIGWVPPSPGAEAEERAFDAHDGALAEVLGVVNAATARLVGLVRQAIDTNAWSEAGCNSPEHWVSARCGVAPARAARLVRIARRLHEFPAVEEVWRSGLATEDQVDVVVRHADAAHDGDLANCVGSVTLGQLRRVILMLPGPDDDAPAPDAGDAVDPEAEAEAEARGERDRVALGWHDDGRYGGVIDVPAALGALADTAFAAARRRLYAERTGLEPDDDPVGVAAITGVDVFDRLLHAALEGLDPATRRGQRPSDRYQALIHLDAEDPERSRIHLGPVLSRAERQLLTCDADVRVVGLRDGRPVSVGRRQRVADPILRALIEDRDGGCRVCSRRGFLHVHHLVHWEDGGPTSPDNLVALCTACHRLVHHGRLRLVGDPTRPDGLLALDASGRPVPRPSPMPVRALPPAPAPYLGPCRDGRLSFTWI